MSILQQIGVTYVLRVAESWRVQQMLLDSQMVNTLGIRLLIVVVLVSHFIIIISRQAL